MIHSVALLLVMWNDSFGCRDTSSSDLIHLLNMLQISWFDSFIGHDISPTG